MIKQRLSAAALVALMALALLAWPALAQTQPPNAVPPPGGRVWICHFDANDGLIYLEYVQPDKAPVDRGVATEGMDTLAEGMACQIPEAQWPTVVSTAQPTQAPLPASEPTGGPTAVVLPTATDVPPTATMAPERPAEPTAVATELAPETSPVPMPPVQLPNETTPP